VIETDVATSIRMGRIRQRDTEPERVIRSWLWSRGLRYRICDRKLPGSPDIANRSSKWAVFVHGCFWHDHRNCPAATKPKRNAGFWAEKISANAVRDRRKREALEALNFDVAVVWECEAKALRKTGRPPASLNRFLRRLDRARQ